VLRAALFAATGLLLGASSLVMLASPSFQRPVTLIDWFATLSLSAALLTLAAALPVLARLVGGEPVQLVALLGGVGAALAGIANLFEDGLHQDWAFLPFIGGTVLLEVGLLSMTLLMALRSGIRVRLLALAPVLTAVDIVVLHSHGGGAVAGVAWVVAAAIVVRNDKN
jgi:hypothetical protein